MQSQGAPPGVDPAAHAAAWAAYFAATGQPNPYASPAPPLPPNSSPAQPISTPNPYANYGYGAGATHARPPLPPPNQYPQQPQPPQPPYQPQGNYGYQQPGPSGYPTSPLPPNQGQAPGQAGQGNQFGPQQPFGAPPINQFNQNQNPQNTFRPNRPMNNQPFRPPLPPNQQSQPFRPVQQNQNQFQQPQPPRPPFQQAQQPGVGFPPQNNQPANHHLQPFRPVRPVAPGLNGGGGFQGRPPIRPPIPIPGQFGGNAGIPPAKRPRFDVPQNQGISGGVGLGAGGRPPNSMPVRPIIPSNPGVGVNNGQPGFRPPISMMNIPARPSSISPSPTAGPPIVRPPIHLGLGHPPPNIPSNQVAANTGNPVIGPSINQGPPGAPAAPRNPSLPSIPRGGGSIRLGVRTGPIVPSVGIGPGVVGAPRGPSNMSGMRNRAGPSAVVNGRAARQDRERERKRGEKERYEKEKKEEGGVKTTMTDFRIVGIEVLESGWRWGLIGHEAKALHPVEVKEKPKDQVQEEDVKVEKEDVTVVGEGSREDDRAKNGQEETAVKVEEGGQTEAGQSQIERGSSVTAEEEKRGEKRKADSPENGTSHLTKPNVLGLTDAIGPTADSVDDTEEGSSKKRTAMFATPEKLDSHPSPTSSKTISDGQEVETGETSPASPSSILQALPNSDAVSTPTDPSQTKEELTSSVTKNEAKDDIKDDISGKTVVPKFEEPQNRFRIYFESPPELDRIPKAFRRSNKRWRRETSSVAPNKREDTLVSTVAAGEDADEAEVAEIVDAADENGEAEEEVQEEVEEKGETGTAGQAVVETATFEGAGADMDGSPSGGLQNGVNDTAATDAQGTLQDQAAPVTEEAINSTVSTSAADESVPTTDETVNQPDDKLNETASTPSATIPALNIEDTDIASTSTTLPSTAAPESSLPASPSKTRTRRRSSVSSASSRYDERIRDSSIVPDGYNSKDVPKPSMNRISILYEESSRRICIDADVVERIKIYRGEGKIEVVLKEREDGMRGILMETYDNTDERFVSLPLWSMSSVYPESDDPSPEITAESESIPPLHKSTTTTIIVWLNKKKPLSEPKWCRSNGADEWLFETFGNSQLIKRLRQRNDSSGGGETKKEGNVKSKASDANAGSKGKETENGEDGATGETGGSDGEDEGWRGKLLVVDPDPSPTLTSILHSWTLNSSSGLLKDRQGFIKSLNSDPLDLLEILLRLARGDRNPTLGGGLNPPSLPSSMAGSYPASVGTSGGGAGGGGSSGSGGGGSFGSLASAIRFDSPYASHQTHVSLAILQMYRLTMKYAEMSGEKDTVFNEKVGDIVRSLPVGMIQKSLDGLFREWGEGAAKR